MSVVAALAKVLNPSIGLVRDLMPRWSYSTRLFKYFEDRSVVRFQRLSSFANSRTRSV